MVPTDIFESKVTGHIHRDMAGLFTASATTIRQTNHRATTDIDIEMLRCARRIISRTESNWRRLTP